MKRLLRLDVLLIIIVLLVDSSATQVQGIEVVSPDGGFSYQIPKGWKLIDAAGACYKAAVDPARQAKIIVNTSSAIYVTENENGRQLLPMNVERFRYETLRWEPSVSPISKSLRTPSSRQTQAGKGCAR